MQPFLAMIMPVSGGLHPDNTLPGWQPTPRPPGGGGPVDPGYSPPWAQVPVDPGYGVPIGGGGLHPSHPIYYPPGIWGPTDPRPTPPIYIPPEGSPPPLGIWGPTDPRPTHPIAGVPGLPGSPDQQPHPEHPIVLPPNLPPVIPPEGGQPERPITWKVIWTPKTGWAVIGIPSEGTLVPTPSA